VVVKEGDNLFRIILRAYGTYNDNLVHLVLSANPEISSPQQIVVGRAIKLPEVK
jgi:phage tail protein X